MLSGVFWSIVLRMAQVLVEAAPTLLCGLIVAGVMRRMMGGEGIRRLFGGAGWKGLLRAWAIGTLLPVCSLGVIPIAREMRRARVPAGTILAFILAAPHLNPLSLLYGVTMSEPIVIICFALGSLLIALLAGAVWDRLPGATAEPDQGLPDEPNPAPGLQRLASVAVAAARESVGPTLGYTVLALAYTGLLGGLLPFGCLSTTMQPDNPFAPLLMTVLATPAFVGTLPGMMKLGLMFEHGNSISAAFVLFELGIGVNLGTAFWLSRTFGWRRALPWLGLVVAVTLVLAYSIEKPLVGKEPESHTHAFDDWASPFLWGQPGSGLVVRDKLLEKVGLMEPVALLCLAGLMLMGALLNRFDRTGRLETALCAPAPARAAPTSVWDRPVPGPVLGVLALLGLVVFSVVALYLYYPSAEDGFKEIARVRADAVVAVNAGHRDEAIRELERWDLLTRKLQVGVLIRTGRMSPETVAATEALRDRLEEVRDAMLANDLAAARKMVPALHEAHGKCRASYAPEQE